MARLPGRDLRAQSGGPLQWIRAGPAGVLGRALPPGAVAAPRGAMGQ